MQANEQLSVIGDLVVSHYIAETKETKTIPLKNLVVASGKSYIASRILNANAQPMSYMAVGAGAIPAVSTDVALGSELSRVALTSAVSASNVVTFTATFPAGVGTGAISEAGLFSAVSGGLMLSRTVFSVVNKAPNDIITITWNITIL